MAKAVGDRRDTASVPESTPGILDFAGVRYWTASLLPALVGTTLPFWLRHPRFESFNWLGAIEFILATLLLHSGFSFLKARFDGDATSEWPESKLLGAGAASMVAACLIGLHLNTTVPDSIFLVFGLAAFFAGVIYVAPPFSFCKRPFGEVVISFV